MEANEQNRSKEQISDENAFLKMKLMLEHGTRFETDQANGIPPEIENMFLHNVMALENRWSEQEMVRVFDHIGRPGHFIPANEISDHDIHDAWNELRALLNRHSIDLNVCSPNISERELYRFTMEELFEQEMLAMDMPGWNYNFIYDEFHPDPVYESINAALWGMRGIFRKEPLAKDDPRFKNEKLALNRYRPIDRPAFDEIINRFKDSFEDIVLTSTRDVQCSLAENLARIHGVYRAKCRLGDERIIYRGKWEMDMEMEEANQWWMIRGVNIEGIEF
jgi:hypothetical protein